MMKIPSISHLSWQQFSFWLVLFFFGLGCLWWMHRLVKQKYNQRDEKAGHKIAWRWIIIDFVIQIGIWGSLLGGIVVSLSWLGVDIFGALHQHFYLEILSFLICLFGVVYFINHFIQEIAIKYVLDEIVDQSVIKAIQVAIIGLKGLMFVVAVLAVLGAFGVDVGAAIAGLGLTGFALGFAFKDFLSSLVAGLLLAIYRPFNKGQHIKVGAHDGIVWRYTLRYTYLRNGQELILIPNAALFNKEITITTHFQERAE